MDGNGATARIASPARAKRRIPHPLLWLLAVPVGVVAGFGAVLFRLLIGILHNIFFLGKLSAVYNANEHTSSNPWGPFIILAPVLGSIGVAWLVKNFAIEAKGHGVPEVMEAIYYNKGIIRPVVALIKSLASALSIGSGGSVGREGPIVQIGSAFGSGIAQALRLPLWQRITMIAAGAGGGIAATFNTPIGGVLFAAELLLHEVSVWTLVPVVISTATATYIGRLYLGDTPAFVIPALQLDTLHPTSLIALLACVGLGCLTGLVSALFIKSIYAFEDFFERDVPGNYYSRHTLGMLAVGVTLYVMWRVSGHYYVQGVGYATVQDTLTGSLNTPLFLLLLFALKLFVTSLTLGSGGSGGIFSPSLFLGATFGGVFGIILLRWFPYLHTTPPAFAVIGMAGVVGGSTGAALTAVVMIFEMTRDYDVILPMTITVAISYGVRKFMCGDSIYTRKLARRGRHVPGSRQADFPLVRLARDVMDPHIIVVTSSTLVRELPKILANRASPVDYFLVDRQQNLAGIVKNDPVLDALSRNSSTLTFGDIAIANFQVVRGDATMHDIISKMHSDHVSFFPVSFSGPPVSTSDFKGMITREEIAEVMTQTISLSTE